MTFPFANPTSQIRHPTSQIRHPTSQFFTMPESNHFDAIVVGSGISGGWAAKELCEKGLKTLVLERGRDVKHGDYPTAFTESWEIPGRTRLNNAELVTQPKQNRTGYTTHPTSAHWFVNDVENPYS